MTGKNVSRILFAAFAVSLSSCALLTTSTEGTLPVPSVFAVPGQAPAYPAGAQAPAAPAAPAPAPVQEGGFLSNFTKSSQTIEVPAGVLKDNDRFGTHYMASSLSANIKDRGVAGAPVIITTFVDLNDLAQTSVFGRMVAEKMIDEMNRQGFHVVEFRRAQDIFLKKDGGEFILTRDVSELSGTTAARAVLAGTYLATQKTLIINARLMDIKSPQVLSTVSFEIQKTDEIDSMLRGGQ